MKNHFIQQLTMAVLGVVVCGQASAVIINDDYWGADGFPKYSDRDRIGDERYEVYNMEVTFTDLFMNVKINTNFINTTINPDPYGVDYGDLFISNNGWTPSGSSTDRYNADNASNGEHWEYVFDTSENTLYGGAFSVLFSSDFFDANRYIFRNGPQEVQRGAGGDEIAGSSVDLDNAGSFIEYNVLLSSLGLTSSTDIGLRWEMTCANDAIEGAASYSVPEPATILMFGIGLLGLAFSKRARVS